MGYASELEEDREITELCSGGALFLSTPYNSVLSLERAEQGNPASSRNRWHKHRKVVTSSPGQSGLQYSSV